MNFEEMKTGIRVLEKYATNEIDPRIGKITGAIEAENDQVWITLYRTTDDPDLTPEEIQELEDAGWFLDEEHGGWSHYA